MKLLKLLFISSIAACSIYANSDVMQKSMSAMEQGMALIQKGFLNNNVELIKEGNKLVQEGNSLFAKEGSAAYLPENKKHLANIADNASKRIALDVVELEENLKNKAFIKAGNSYSDMLNACSNCHSIVRGW